MGVRSATILGILAVAAAACGPAAADFGPLGVDCKALGKAGAVAAEVDGPAALYWNPAGLARRPGFLAAFSFGMLQRPDLGLAEYGSTDRTFLAAAWAGEGDGLAGRIALGLAVEKPFPRFDYAGSRRLLLGPTPAPMILAVDSSQDYLEILAGLGVKAFEGKVAGRDSVLRAGMSVGLGFSSNSVSASLTSLTGPPLTEVEAAAGQTRLLPVGLGVQFSMDLGSRVQATFAVRYRGVLSLGDEVWITFPQQQVDVTTADLFMPPPQEGGIGLSLDFFDSLVYSIELGYVFFDGPDAFADFVPHNYPVLKMGFEYRVPLPGPGDKELSMRAGFSNASVGGDNLETVYTASARGVYLGWGYRPDPLAQLDFYFTIQLPGDGPVEGTTFLASASYGIRF